MTLLWFKLTIEYGHLISNDIFWSFKQLFCDSDLLKSKF